MTGLGDFYHEATFQNFLAAFDIVNVMEVAQTVDMFDRFWGNFEQIGPMMFFVSFYLSAP